MEKPKEKIKFKCKVDKCILHAKFGDFGNLNKHLLIHEISKKWYKLYQAYSGDEINLDDGISEEKLNLIKFFVTSNIALAALENVFLRNILKDEIQMPSISGIVAYCECVSGIVAYCECVHFF